MDERLADMPVMAQRLDVIDAKIFNLWRRYRQRPDALGRFKLIGLRSMRFILADTYWVVADSANFDAPVLAWTDFDVASRFNLHEPIACTINYYHFAASAVRAKALNSMAGVFEEALQSDYR